MARAVYAPATFVGSTATAVTLAVPNAVHRGKCEQHRSAVEAALAALAGAPVTIELVEGGGDGGGRPAAAVGVASGSATSPGTAHAGASREPVGAEASFDTAMTAVLPDDDDVDLDDLVDAPPEAVKSPIDRLAEAFPGSELIEEAG
jgi:DNA polymerase-3 subunit gamma/tau